MSGRGGKRRQVLQLGSASKLHRYGYSKEFQSRDQKGKSTVPTLVGDYSDTDSEDNSESEEQIITSTKEEEADADVAHVTTSADSSAVAAAFPDRTDGSDMQDKAPDMDDELKHFLSEIEAIPMPTVLDDNEQSKITDSEAVVTADEAAADTRKPSMYSMFVKGESEFVHSPKQADDGGGDSKVSTQPDEEEVPEEPHTDWQMVEDDNTQYFYYWNTVTNVVTWEIPTEYTQYLLLYKEYEEKKAKFTPKQLQKLKEKSSKAASKDSCLDQPKEEVSPPSSHELKPEVQSLTLSPSHVDKQDEKSHKVTGDLEHVSGPHTDISPSESMSPHQDVGHESKHHKHKKERRSHHKKKHKRRHEGSQSDEDKRSPKIHDSKPVIVSSESFSGAVVTGQKLLSIVPYLSDQDENEDDDNDNPSIPVLGTHTSSTKETNVVEHRQEPGESISSDDYLSAALTDSHTSAVQGTSQSALSLESADPVLMLLLPPPPPPPPPEEEEELTEDQQEDNASVVEENNSKNIVERTGTHESQLQKIPQENPEGPSSDFIETNLFKHESGGLADGSRVTENLVSKTQGTVADSNEDTKLDSFAGKTASKVPEVKKCKTKEIIDMFAEHFTLSVIANEDGSNVSTAPKSLVKEVLQKPELSGELMEDGEIQDAPEEAVVVQENASLKNTSVVDNKKTLPKSLNIVGYASDEEEEEIEEKVSRKDKKHKKKDKRKDSKKRRKEKESSTLTDSSRDQKNVDKVSDVIHKVNQETRSLVSDTEVKTSKRSHDEGDIDFEDIDDIDRALEVALEKRLEKRKVEQMAKKDDKEKKCADEEVHNLTSGESLPKHSTSDIAQVKNQDTNGSIANIENSDPAIKKHDHDNVITTSEQDDLEHVANINEMAELALNKLEFLDISTDSLSRLQVLFIELQTRHTDWKAGGLSTQYYYDQLKIAEDQLEQYELSAVPEGWLCQWDRANNRYYYRNKATNRTQWEYPESETAGKGESKTSAAANSEESVTKVRSRGTDERRRSRGSSSSGRHRKRDEKDKSKYDKRSSTHHYRRKRRRGRDQSNSSNTSPENQHRHHRKSKKRKRHRTERSPSVEIVESIDVDNHTDNIDGVEIVEMTDAPNSVSQTASPSLSATTSDVPDSKTETVAVEVLVAGSTQSDLTKDGWPTQLPAEDTSTVQDMNHQAEEVNCDNVDSSLPDESAMSVVNTAVISKPPQILIHPQQIAALHSDSQIPAELYAPLTVTSAQASLYPSNPVLTEQTNPVLAATEQTNPAAEVANESGDTTAETDKKKKKKEKKPLATGSSIMMKKKHMSSMVQKWQKVKIEVEKEDRAKELRQAAIRKKIEELKNTDKQPQS